MTTTIVKDMFSLKLMNRKHLNQVTLLDKAYDDQESWDEQRYLDEIRAGATGYVLYNGSESDRDEAEIISFSLHQQDIDTFKILKFIPSVKFRWSLVDKKLTEKLASKLVPDKLSKIKVFIREHDDYAREFFCAQGYKGVGVSRNKFRDGEDAWILQYQLIQPYLPTIVNTTCEYGDLKSPPKISGI